MLVWSFIHCITCSGVVRNIKKVPKASFISESLCILSCFLRMFISSATITENYTTYWEKVKSTVITGPPAEYVVRGVSTESFQVSLTGQTLQINDTLYHIIDDHVCFWRGFQFCLRKTGGITFLANTCSTHRESYAEDRLFFKQDNFALSFSSSGAAWSWQGK